MIIRVGIVGATGYAGEELINILLRHPQVRITSLSAKIGKPQDICAVFPRLQGRISLNCQEPDIRDIIKKCDTVFLALPHTVSMGIVPSLLKGGRRVIDLSADYRLRDRRIYEKFYHVKQKDKTNLTQAVYGLPEIYRLKIKKANLIANPGCYPTAAILALAPLAGLGLADTDRIIVDAKSGVTGAGRRASVDSFFAEINEDFKAYKVDAHQHIPEINQELSKLAGEKVKVTFVPHLLPLNRGIIETIYVQKNKNGKFKAPNLISLYRNFYKNEPFVRIRPLGYYPSIKDVAGTNFCDIGIKEGPGSVIIISAIDNLLKGAAGQAVQNMNIMYKFPEQTALL